MWGCPLEVIMEQEQMGNSMAFTFSCEFQEPCLYLREIPGHLLEPFKEKEKKKRKIRKNEKEEILCSSKASLENNPEASTIQPPHQTYPCSKPPQAESLDEKERCSGCKIQIL